MFWWYMFYGVLSVIGLVIRWMLVLVCCVVCVSVKFILLLEWFVRLCIGLSGLNVGLVVISMCWCVSIFGVKCVMIVL